MFESLSRIDARRIRAGPPFVPDVVPVGGILLELWTFRHVQLPVP